MNVQSTSRLPVGFQASGSTCGIKISGKPDLAIFVSDRDATAAGVFTTNRVCGAPVIVSKQRVPSTVARAVIINSGNSNAATGERGIQDAKQMTTAVAEQLGCDKKSAQRVRHPDAVPTHLCLQPPRFHLLDHIVAGPRLSAGSGHVRLRRENL